MVEAQLSMRRRLLKPRSGGFGGSGWSYVIAHPNVGESASVSEFCDTPNMPATNRISWVSLYWSTTFTGALTKPDGIWPRYGPSKPWRDRQSAIFASSKALRHSMDQLSMYVLRTS